MIRKWETETNIRKRAEIFYNELIVVKEYDGKGGWASDIDLIEELMWEDPELLAEEKYDFN